MDIQMVPFIKNLDLDGIEKIHSILDAQPKHALTFHLWEAENAYRPEVSFSLVHSNHSVLLKFFVKEKEMRAHVTKANGAVWEDSCVEFFISFDEKGHYNFEFNCIGTVLAAFGKGRNGRFFLPEELLKRIATYANLNKKGDVFAWEIAIVIPKELFVYHSLQSLNGLVCKANFYKCGDGLLQPHYLSWSKIESRVPDFHLPEFFKELSFE